MGNNQARQGVNQLDFHRPTKRTSSQEQVSPTVKNQTLGRWTHLDQQGHSGLVHGSSVDIEEELVEDTRHVLALQCLENQDLVEPIEELKRKRLAGG